MGIEALDKIIEGEAPKKPSSGLKALEDAIAAPTAPPSPSAEEPAHGKGKKTLNAENQALLAANERLTGFVKALGAAIAVLCVIIGALILYIRGTDARKTREAFQMIAYREAKTLQANAIVLAEYANGLKAIRDMVSKLTNIAPEEIQYRVRVLTSTIDESENLERGFLKMIQDNEKERGRGASFEYKDPFLKRPIKFDEEMGGEISLDKLRDEVKANAKMDEAMKELREAMLNPMPFADQMRVEAKRQNAPVVGPDGVVPSGGPAAPIQALPGLRPEPAPAPAPTSPR